MEVNEIELVDSGEKRDLVGRRILRREERDRLLAAYDESGLTQRAFARREGIKYSTLAWWLKQRRERNRGNAPVQFEEYRISEPVNTAPLEVVLADGTRVRGSDTGMLAELVKSLRA